jgi:hypothetical protein
MTLRMKTIVLALAAAMLVTIMPVAAQKDSNSQAGGVPNLADQIAALRADIAALQPNPKLLFTEHDKVVAFDPGTGIGAQTGVAIGKITGASIVNFRFSITAFPNFTFVNRAGITDVDGDQIIFANVGTGRFIIPALSDPTLGGNPGAAPFQVFGNGLGGPLVGTYQVVATSGKYVGAYPISQLFDYRAVAYNPSTPPTAPGTVGSVYIEVFER